MNPWQQQRIRRMRAEKASMHICECGGSRARHNWGSTGACTHCDNCQKFTRRKAVSFGA